MKRITTAAVAFVSVLFVAPFALAATHAPSGWVLYVSHEKGFSVGVPANMIVVDDGTQGVEVTRSETGTSDFSVGVFSDIASLEKSDVVSGSTSYADSNAKEGLKPAKVIVDGKSVVAYYGKHAVDGVGGKEYPYIGIEIAGSQHAYLLQFYKTSNLKNATVKKYLASFHAE